MGKRTKIVLGSLISVCLLGFSCRLYELHREWTHLHTEVNRLEQQLKQLTLAHQTLEQVLEKETYKAIGVRYALLHPPTPKPTPTPKTNHEWKTFKMSAYVAKCKEGCTGKTATGYRLKNAKKDRVIAVDPKVIPLYAIVEIEGYGLYRALDTGGAIRGQKIDLFVDTVKEARKIGVKKVRLRVIETPKRKGAQYVDGRQREVLSVATR